MTMPCPNSRRRLAQTRLRVKASLMMLLPLWPLWPLIASAPAAAQTFPGKPIKLIIGFPAGGPLDAHARLLTDKLGSLLGQPVIVDYKASAGGGVGAEFVARSEADGYTLLMANTGTMVINPGDLQQTVVPDLARLCPGGPHRAAAPGPGGEPCGASATWPSWWPWPGPARAS